MTEILLLVMIDCIFSLLHEAKHRVTSAAILAPAGTFPWFEGCLAVGHHVHVVVCYYEVSMVIHRIYIGGWFQRTTLHLTEMWDFLDRARSRLDFPAEELAMYRTALSISSAKRESGALEYVAVGSSNGIGFRIYEDGLIVLEKKFESLVSDFSTIKEYYDGPLSRAISYIFSKGAPVPKELANIETILPFIVTVSDASEEDVRGIFSDAHEHIYSSFSTDNVGVYRASGLIVINNIQDEELSRSLIESQIFFREFKAQLYRYLAIHRSIWGKIQAIKERGTVRGTQVDVLKNDLIDYQKTINLIGARIEQMPSYVKTRQKLTDLENIDPTLQPLFQFKFETLLDTHEYIKHLWGMTKNYLSSALDLFSDLQGKSTKNTISSLQLITTIGVVAAIFGYLGKDTLPPITLMGLGYFVLLLVLTWVLNSIVSFIYKSRAYKIESKDYAKDV